MHRLLLATAFAAIPAIALAAPPQVGTTYTFDDPIFEGTVICDTFDQVLSIATAESPQDVFLDYLQLANEHQEPTCATLRVTGEIVDVKPLGTMIEDGLSFHAYAVEARFGDVTAFALYLEHFEDIKA